MNREDPLLEIALALEKAATSDECESPNDTRHFCAHAVIRVSSISVLWLWLVFLPYCSTIRSYCLCATADFVKRSLYPNVDFFSGIVLRILGAIPGLSYHRPFSVCAIGPETFPLRCCHCPDGRVMIDTQPGIWTWSETSSMCSAGIPVEMFTCMFAVARSVGWVAQVLLQC